MIRGAKHLYAVLRYRIIGMETHGNNGPGQNAAIPSREKSFDLISAGFFPFFWSFWHFSPWDYETFHCHVTRYLDAWWLSTITGAPNRTFPLPEGKCSFFWGGWWNQSFWSRMVTSKNSFFSMRYISTFFGLVCPPSRSFFLNYPRPQGLRIRTGLKRGHRNSIVNHHFP